MLVNSRVLAISYHYIREKKDILYPGIHPITPEEYLKQLKLLCSQHPIITPIQFESWMEGRPTADSSVLLTFDDGLRDHLYAATELERLNLRGAFFVCSRPALDKKALPVHKIHWLRSHTHPDEFLHQFFELLPDDWKGIYNEPSNHIRNAAAETYKFDPPKYQILKYLINFTLPYKLVDQITTRMLFDYGITEEEFCQRTYLTSEELRGMAARGHLICCHGHLHHPLSRFEKEELLADIKTNQEFLQSNNLTPSWLAYPYGSEWSLPQDTRTFAIENGIRAAFTYDRGWNTPNIPHDRLRRIDCTEIESHLD